jgi:hypothetical protein
MEKLPVECCKNIRYENLGDFIIFSYLCNKAKKVHHSPESESPGRDAAEARKQTRTKRTFFINIYILTIFFGICYQLANNNYRFCRFRR